MTKLLRSLVPAALAAALLSPSLAQAVLIAPGDVIAIPGSLTVPAGNGGLNLRMMTFAGGEVGNTDNTAPAFNGDNGNNSLPNNSGTSTFDAYYYTTVGEIQDFYNKYFSDGMGGSIVNEIVLMLDLSENGGAEATNNVLSKLDIWINPTVTGLNPAGDLTSAQQAAILAGDVSGGTLAANLQTSLFVDGGPGQGVANFAIFTNIDPFLLPATDRILFNVGMSGLSNGSEEIFLSNLVSGPDVLAAVPEASAFLYGGLISLGLCGWASRQRRRVEQALALGSRL
jgi:hypothetical protein